MGLNQRHEQHNKDIKGNGGVLGLTEDQDKLQQWMVCGPEVTRAVAEFESSSVLQKEETTAFRHHEQTSAFQKRFSKHVNIMTEEFQKLGSSFMDSYGEELAQISTRDIMDGAVVKTVRTIEDLGKQAYNKFIKERIKSSRKEIEDPVKKNKLSLFSTIYRAKQACRADIEKTSLKNDVRIFSQLFIATQRRDGDLEKFFSHKNSANPLSLACGSKIRSGVKADLLPCLIMTVSTESVVTATPSGTQNISTTDRNDTTSVEPAGTQVKMTIPEKVDGKVLEGSVLVNLLKPAKKMTFTEYDRAVFCQRW